MSERIDAVVAGHLCLDITPQFRASAGGEFFRPGTLTEVGPATLSTGGPVSNTALPMLRLGMDVKLMGKVGDDAFGSTVLDLIAAEAPGAESGMAVVAGEETSYTIVLARPGVDRMFLHCTGANDTFASDDVDLDVVSRARLFHFGYPPLLARTYARGGEELERILRGARQAGATTSLDLVYTDPSSPAGAADWSAILGRTLRFVDVFPPSFEELLFMLRRDRFDALAARAAETGREMLDYADGPVLADLAEAGLDAGAGVVVIKCGRHGLYLRSAGADRLERMGRAAPADPSDWADRELFCPAFAVQTVVSGTGAGDCAIAGFLTGLLRGADLSTCLHAAAAVGAQNVSAADAVSGVRGWDETLAQIAAGGPRAEVGLALPGFCTVPETGLKAGPRDRSAG